MLITFSELRDKEIINVCDGKRLGYVCDLQIDAENGRICALILPSRSLLASFKKGSALEIPFSCIRRIGKDLILVDMGQSSICK